jgi:hypothetical protein
VATNEHKNSKVDRRRLHPDDAYNRAQARKQDLDMALTDPQVGPVERRGPQIGSAPRGNPEGSSHGTGQ